MPLVMPNICSRLDGAAKIPAVACAAPYCPARWVIIRYVAISGPVSTDDQPRNQKSDDTPSPTPGTV